MVFEKVKFLEWGEDRWGSRNGSVLEYDKVEHFMRDFGISVVFGFIPALVFNLVWEYVDGTRPWALGQEVEGWSMKDFIAGSVGAITGQGVRILLKMGIVMGVMGL